MEREKSKKKFFIVGGFLTKFARRHWQEDTVQEDKIKKKKKVNIWTTFDDKKEANILYPQESCLNMETPVGGEWGKILYYSNIKFKPSIFKFNMLRYYLRVRINTPTCKKRRSNKSQ